MNAPSYGDEAPIAAFATALTESALAVIRTSGKNALDLAATVFSRPGQLLEAPGNSLAHGWIVRPVEKPEKPDKTEKIDEVVISVYRGPRSFTGEDGAEISCHGGIAAARAVMETLKSAGFREALPGEFSFRAFMNGKLDLTRAESVMELVSARTDRGRSHAVHRLAGALEEEIRNIKSLLVRALAETELFLDYSEDDGIGAESAGGLPSRSFVEEALARLKALAATYPREKLYRDGVLAVIAGKPNAGKSSLFNQLLQEDRSIVSDRPGTTRDWIEAWISIEGIPLRLADTAGLQESQDPVEGLGIERSRSLLAAADLILYVIDGGAGLTAEDRLFFQELSGASGCGLGHKRLVHKKAVIALWNKADLGKTAIPAALPGGNGGPVLAISAKTGEGIAALKKAAAATLECATSGAAPGEGGKTASTLGIGTERQKELIDTAISSVEEALTLTARSEPLDLIAPLLRESVSALGEITGEVSTADLLEEIFSRFCVGK